LHQTIAEELYEERLTACQVIDTPDGFQTDQRPYQGGAEKSVSVGSASPNRRIVDIIGT
jgi:hypothetical protein